MSTLWSHANELGRPKPKKGSSAQRRPQGRVLRVKDGYNPNSSSIGSTIPGFLAFAAAAGGLTVLLLNLLNTAGDLLRKQKDGSPQPTAPPRSNQNEGDDGAQPGPE